MRGHSKKGRQPIKARRRKAVTRKRRNSAEAAGHHRSSSTAGQETTVARLTRERDEALEQQAAISDILGVISNSPADVQPVLDTVAKHAAHICEARVVEIVLVDNEVFRIATSFSEAERLSRPEKVQLDRSTVTGRAICDLRPVHVADLQNAKDDFPLGWEFAIKHGHRTILSVPLIREGNALGAIVVRRAEVRLFEEKHIALLKAFADQAAIAIENVRLFEAERQRTRELAESLEQQTATSEVLQVISSLPGDLDSIFQAILSNATRICEAKFGTLYLCDADAFRVVGMHNPPPAYAEARQREPLVLPPPDSVLGRVSASKDVVHIADARQGKSYIERNPYTIAGVELGGYRTVLGVPKRHLFHRSTTKCWHIESRCKRSRTEKGKFSAP